MWLNAGSSVRLRPASPNHVWAYDFVHERTHDGQALRLLTVVDEYTRECPAIRVARHDRVSPLRQRAGADRQRRAGVAGARRGHHPLHRARSSLGTGTTTGGGSAVGQWNTVWDPFYQLDPAWTDEFMAVGVGIYGSGVMPAKEVELLSIQNALKAGATMEEIVEVRKLCVVQGVQACNLAVPILA